MRNRRGRREPEEGRGTRIALAVACILAALFVAGFVAVPVLEASGFAAAGWVRLLYAPLCHQIPSRSLEIAGRPMAVCARCTGLYLGGALGLVLAAVFLASRLRRLPIGWLAAAVAPTVLDALAAFAGWGLPNLPRMILAVPAGVALGLLLAEAIADLVHGRTSPRAPRRSFSDVGSDSGRR